MKIESPFMSISASSSLTVLCLLLLQHDGAYNYKGSEDIQDSGFFFQFLPIIDRIHFFILC